MLTYRLEVGIPEDLAEALLEKELPAQEYFLSEINNRLDFLIKKRKYHESLNDNPENQIRSSAGE